MSRRVSPEARVMEFFQQADPAVALTTFRIVRALLETRGVFKPEANRQQRLARPSPPLLLDTRTDPEA